MDWCEQGLYMGLSGCVQTTLDGLTLIEIEVQPGSSRQGVIGFNEWRGRLQVAVKAEAQKGKANHAVCAVLSQSLGAKVSVVAGHTTRLKKISVEGMNASQIISRLEVLLES